MYMYLCNFDKHINLQQVMCLYYDFNQDWHRLFFSYTKHSKINRLLRKCTFTKKTPPQTLGVKYGFDIYYNLFHWNRRKKTWINRNINTNVIKYTRYIRQLLDPHNATFLSVIYVILSTRTQSHTQSRRSNQPWEC